MNNNDGPIFEDEVRRVARQLWPSAEYDGARMVSGREHDGVFITEENVHLVECTISRGKDKAAKDVEKLAKQATSLRSLHPDKAIKCWFVTYYEPTADQRSIVNSQNKHSNTQVVAVSLEQFRSKLIDSKTYLSFRKDFRFGSMEPKDARDEDFYFVEPDILDESDNKLSIEELVANIQDGGRYAILGDYGVGKSTTMREIFLKMRRQALRQATRHFPVHLNLRDHFGQKYPSEALERHSRDIGFAHPHHLVRAWRAGYVTLLLDGFDEIGKAGWSIQASRLGKLRYDSMELIRGFIKDTPDNCGIVVAGRTSYFDSDIERRRALLLNDGFTSLRLLDFSEKQVEIYLKNAGLEKQQIPAWLPSRPLLLGYLASRGLLDEVAGLSSTLDPALGWDHLLQRICDREARIEFGIDGNAIRLLIERLASKARSDIEGLGPLQLDDILAIFKEICGNPPDDQSIVLINRLPGLGAPRSEDGARNFVDQSLAEAARAGDVTRFIQNPYGQDVPQFNDWERTLTTLGRQVTAFQCTKTGLSEGQLRAAIEQATNRNEHYALGADLIQVAQELDLPYHGAQLYIRGVFHSEMSIGENERDFSRVEYQHCVAQTLEIASECDTTLLPKFRKCTFGTVEGRISQRDLPTGVFIDCDFQEFANPAQTNNAILTLDLSLGQRILLVVLKKLYLQSGSGRKESALYRGLDQRGKALVPPVLKLLKQEGLVCEVKSAAHSLWLPVRSESARVRKLLASPSSTLDSLIKAAAQLV